VKKLDVRNEVGSRRGLQEYKKSGGSRRFFLEGEDYQEVRTPREASGSQHRWGYLETDLSDRGME